METVEYRSVTRREDLINAAPMLLARLLYVTVLGWGMYSLSSSRELVDWLILLAMVAGIVCAELAVVVYSRVYRQTIWTIEGSPFDDSLADTYSRLTANFTAEVIACPALWVLTWVGEN
jgi:hypothetical protein